jgi:hypothetical protein
MNKVNMELVKNEAERINHLPILDKQIEIHQLEMDISDNIDEIKTWNEKSEMYLILEDEINFYQAILKELRK